MGELFFRTEGLTVGYNGVPLIRDITFRVERGEILTLIGPNGSGKSTILKSVTRQLKTLGGTVYIGERDMKDISQKELAKQMSVVLTERIRTELMTCRDIVATGRYPYTGRLGILDDADRAVVRESMEMVHVWDLRDRDFMQLSDGQRQRIMLARAICQETKTLLLDEPTSYLDIHYQIELLNTLRHLVNTRKVGIIMSLHELPLARKVSDWVVCIKGDSVVAQGSVEDIFTSAVIDELYGLKPGSFDPVSGNIELDASSRP